MHLTNDHTFASNIQQRIREEMETLVRDEVNKAAEHAAKEVKRKMEERIGAIAVALGKNVRFNFDRDEITISIKADIRN